MFVSLPGGNRLALQGFDIAIGLSGVNDPRNLGLAQGRPFLCLKSKQVRKCAHSASTVRILGLQK
jgi:hypothetical protein